MTIGSSVTTFGFGIVISIFYVQLPTFVHLSQLFTHIPTFVSKDEVTSSL